MELNLNELKLILDAVNGLLMLNPEEEVKWLWVQVDDAIRLEYLDKKWKVDGKALVEKLKKASQEELMAIYHMSMEFWKEQYKGIRSDEEILQLWDKHRKQAASGSQ